ncbi:hypothetical protein Tco_1054657 [Tanacetum coccineum]|uniref:Reverse transcriptase domain-containing protein n=1 Tax=Tanacetum coccineum TaxID=301880 RepID=A0ABQ5GXG3_9ASTR
MEISIADQIALDDALVAPADRLKIGKCNLRLSSDVTSKEATLPSGPLRCVKTHSFLQGIPKLTNEDIRISESYKEYHAIASGKIPPKTKGVHRNPEIKGHSFDPNLVNPPPPPCNGQQTRVSDHLASSPNMLNPNQDTGFDDIFGQHTEATSLIDTPVTAIVEPSFTAQTNRPPTLNPLIIQIQQPPILTPANTTSSSLQNLPNFASLFGFDYRLKALEGQLLRTQTKQIIMLNALSSIPGGR